MAERTIEVVVMLGSEEVVVGRLWSHSRRGRESQTFVYDDAYLGREGAYDLDPGLPLATGQHQTPADRQIFGAFSDTAPDRWGRMLITRDERKRARNEGGTPKSFGESDYLLGVRDDLRQGALRFRELGTEEYLAPPETGVPALLELPELLGAADRLERDEESAEELAALLRGGSSLGGARPKAHVLSQDGRVAIAKFPSAGADEWDVMRWEAVALQLAGEAGIRVPGNALRVVDGKPVLILDRFDRSDTGRRGYVSALTMLGGTNGDRGSYIEIADVIIRHSPSATEDLRELWRRMVYSVLISNFDDHLRNHGFLRTSTAGWSLSPAFDLNPDPRVGERHLTTAIDLDDTSAEIDLPLDVASEFQLDRNQALAVLREVSHAVAQWGDAASGLGLSRDEIDQMRPAFEHEAAAEARRLVGP